MIAANLKTILLATALIALCGFTFGQGTESIDIRFLKAKFTDTAATKNLMTIFLVSTQSEADFPPQIQLPPKCTVFENGREKVVLLNPNNMAVSFWGDKIVENEELYKLIKDQIDIKAMKSTMIIVYTIKDLNYTFRKMSMTPAFKEKNNKSIKVAKRCEFNVD